MSGGGVATRRLNKMKSFRDEGRKEDFPQIWAEEEMRDKEKNGGFFRGYDGTHWMSAGWLLSAPALGSVWPAGRCAAAGRCSAEAASARAPRHQFERSPPQTAAPGECGPEQNDMNTVSPLKPFMPNLQCLSKETVSSVKMKLINYFEGAAEHHLLWVLQLPWPLPATYGGIWQLKRLKITNPLLLFFLPSANILTGWAKINFFFPPLDRCASK